MKINPEYEDHEVIIFFKKWVKENYKGKESVDFEDINVKPKVENKEFVIKIDGLCYGPIPYKKVPKKIPEKKEEHKTLFDLI